MSEDWLETGAAELGRGIEHGRIDPRDLVEMFLAAIAAHPESGRIYARTLPARARAAAAKAAERARSGMRRGPLDGVPICWKDNIDIAGEVTEAGSRLLAGRVPERDAVVFANASAAGLVPLGKTHLSELAFSGLGVNPVTATPPNALEADRAPGGSSSGTAVAIALGLAAAGVGTDTGGSVRIPAAWNGLAGLKTTVGRLPTEGVVPLSTRLDTVGPIARTVEDCALLLAALAGEPAEVPPARAPRELRFLVPETLVLDGADPEVKAVFETALAALVEAGARITRAPVPELAETMRVANEVSNVVSREAWQLWGPLIEANPGVMYARIEERFRTGIGIREEADREALAAFARLSAALIERMEAAGPLLMPTSPILPPPVARLLADADYYVERNLMALRNTRLANLLGLSALSVPAPAPMVGLMIVGAPMAEAELLAVGRGVEQVLG